MPDILQEMRRVQFCSDPVEYDRVMNSVFDEFERLRARVAELEAALEPFAAEAGEWNPETSDEYEIFYASEERAEFSVGDLRRARAAFCNDGGDDE